MEQNQLAARVRSTKGKAAARKLRKENKVPAIFYGPKSEPIKLVLDYSELERVLKRAGENMILDLQISSEKGTETRKVMLKEFLTDPVKDTYLHADFYEISMDKKITVSIPIQLRNTPVGVTNGGILQQVRRDLEVSCLPGKVVEALEVDVSDLDIGDAVHIEDIFLPEGISTSEDGHLTVAVVAAPTMEREKVEEGAEEAGEKETVEKEETTNA